jgi:BirA family biotin operon repressor/biotin-[acetyl-CoA-carboxylase] ligase
MYEHILLTERRRHSRGRAAWFFLRPKKCEVTPLRARLIGCEIREFDSIDSTQFAARRLLEQGAASGTVVIAREQTSGRGRLGREWQSGRDAGLYFSVVLLPCKKTCGGHTAHNAAQQYLSLAAGAAIMRVLRQHYGLDAKIKWPNDVFIRGRKVCGILIEGIGGDAIILGIGLNTNLKMTGVSPAAEWAAQATSLSDELGQDIDHPALLIHILEALDLVYAALCRGLFRPVISRVRKNLYGLAREVFFDNGAGGVRSGVFEGIDDEGRALVRTEDGRIHAVMSGEVRIADRD